MGIPLKHLALRAIGAVLLGVLACGPALAHHVVDPLDVAALAPAAGAPEERLTGVLHRLAIDDRVVGIVVHVHSVKLDDGTALSLKGADVDALADGARVELTGRRNGKTLFASAARALAPPALAAVASREARPLKVMQGRLALLHADHFTDGRSEFIFELHEAGGEPTALKFPVFPEPLQSGMQVVVSGRTAADRSGVEPETVTIVALPAPTISSQEVLAKAPVTNNALVILMTFADSPTAPFSRAQVQSAFAGASSSVALYFNEVSFGQQLINATVTDWLPTNAATPSGCNWQQMGTLGRSAAAAAGLRRGELPERRLRVS